MGAETAQYGLDITLTPSGFRNIFKHTNVFEELRNQYVPQHHSFVGCGVHKIEDKQHNSTEQKRDEIFTIPVTRALLSGAKILGLLRGRDATAVIIRLLARKQTKIQQKVRRV